MGKIIAVCVEKGGVGKTTTALSMAVMLMHAGKDVILADCDPQFTLKGWVLDRRNNEVQPDLMLIERTGNVMGDLVTLAGKCDYLVVDTGGRDAPEMRQAIGAVSKVPGSFVLAPTQPGAFDTKTMPTVIKMLFDVHDLTGVLSPCYSFINRASTHIKNIEAQEAREQLSALPNLHVLQSVVRERTAQRRDCSRLGMAATELKGELRDAALAREWSHLFYELFGTGLVGSHDEPLGFEIDKPETFDIAEVEEGV